MPQWAWALTLQPTDKDGGSNPAAVPVSDVLGASCSYGKQGDALNYGGGSMTLALNNSSSKYTPQGGGTYTNAEFLGKVCRLTANVTDSPSGAPASQLNLPGASGDHATATAYARQLTLPGVTGSHAQATFSGADVTGDLEIVARIGAADYTTGVIQTIVSKGASVYEFNIGTTGKLMLRVNGVNKSSSSTPPLEDGRVYWVRVRRVASTGAIEFFYADDQETEPTSWTSTGTASSTAGNIATSSFAIRVGLRAGSGDSEANPFGGRIKNVIVRDGIDGTDVVTFNPTLGLVGASSFTESTGETWNLTGDAILSAVTGDLDIRVQVALDDFTPSTAATLVAQWNVSGDQEAFRFRIATSGNVELIWSEDGTTSQNDNDGGNSVLVDGQSTHLRVTLQHNAGSGTVVQFLQSEDGVDWTLRRSVTKSDASSTSGLHAANAPYQIGAYNTGGSPDQHADGTVFSAQVYDGIDGTIASNFDPAQGAVGGTSFVAATRETWSINGNASLSSPAPAWTHGAPAVFSGVVTDVNWSFDNRFESIMTLTVSDILTMLGTLSFAETDSGNGLDVASGAAATSISAVLAAANAVTSQITQTTVLNPSGDTGKTMQAVANFTGNAGELLQLIEQSDGGDVFVRHGLPVNGTNTYNALTFRTRGQESISDAITGVVDLVPLNIFDSTLTTSGLEPHEFQRIDFASGATASYSQVAFTREGGSVQKASVASANLNAFGARSLTRTGLLTNSDSDTLDLANAFLNQYGVGLVPPLAVRAIEMPPIVEGINNGYELVKFSIGDGCTVRFRPAGASATIVVAGVISGINWDITPGSSNMTVQLEDGDQSVSFVLDSSEFGLLDISRLG